MSFLDHCADFLLSQLNEATGEFPTHFAPDYTKIVSSATDPEKCWRYSAICWLGLLEWEKQQKRMPRENKKINLLKNHAEEDIGLEMMIRCPSGIFDNLPANFLFAPRSLQGASWLLSGLSRHPQHLSLADRLFTHLMRHYQHRDSLFALHHPTSWRRGVVSFGAMAYFARSLFDFAAASGEKLPEIIGIEISRQILIRQRNDGGWPWLYRVFDGWVLEDFPLYTVHQSAMAPMFLLPAREAGLCEADRAIQKSLNWAFRAPGMISGSPLSLSRARARGPEWRIIPALHALLPGRHGDPVRPRIIDGWRSYHLGWLLYVWSGYPEAEERFRQAGLQWSPNSP